MATANYKQMQSYLAQVPEPPNAPERSPRCAVWTWR